MSKKLLDPIVIIHFQPLELYPPVCNLINYLAINSSRQIIVITTLNNKEKKLLSYKNISKQVVIRRTHAIVSNSRLRLFQYVFFYLNSLRLLSKYQPQSVLYFDTISSWPALIYKRVKGNAVKLLAHYHEYLSPWEYANNMFLVKVMHRKEEKMYSQSYSWVSQTNEVRLQKMITDNRLENTGNAVFHIMPNYPSTDWAANKTDFGSSKKIRLVYVGSLGFDTTYLQELTDWVVKNKDHFTLDFYAYNIDEKAKEFLGSVQYDCIQFYGGINYAELPGLLVNYDIGLVIYKPVSENWIYNAPNKMFEYLACGLDVWFSKTMTYSLSLTKEETYPKIIPVDFENLDEFDFQKAISRDGLLFKETNFFYENIYGDILTSLNQ